MIDPNALEEWTAHPLTKELFKKLNDLKDIYGSDLANGKLFGDPNQVEAYSRIVGRVDIIRAVTDLGIFKEDE